MQSALSGKSRRLRNEAGAPMGEADGGGYGLIGMRERVAVFGGTFDARRESGGGFVVEIVLPHAKTRRDADWDRPAAEGLNPHGKEGVDGSSPSEGLENASKWRFLLPRRNTTGSRATRNLSPRPVPKMRACASAWLEQTRLAA